ncbi:MAG: hypothetical protein Q7T97_03435 [Burkholderiaceae bacterium]|nr:hypothetical protein [Burkholderiaceae bacterium]
MDAVGLDNHPVLRLDHRKGGDSLQDLAEHAGVARVEMLDQHEGHATVDGHVPEEQLEGLQPAGGHAQPYDQRGARGVGRAGRCRAGSRARSGLLRESGGLGGSVFGRQVGVLTRRRPGWVSAKLRPPGETLGRAAFRGHVDMRRLSLRRSPLLLRQNRSDVARVRFRRVQDAVERRA